MALLEALAELDLHERRVQVMKSSVDKVPLLAKRQAIPYFASVPYRVLRHMTHERPRMEIIDSIMNHNPLATVSVGYEIFLNIGFDNITQFHRDMQELLYQLERRSIAEIPST